MKKIWPQLLNWWPSWIIDALAEEWQHERNSISGPSCTGDGESVSKYLRKLTRKRDCCVCSKRTKNDKGKRRLRIVCVKCNEGNYSVRAFLHVSVISDASVVIFLKFMKLITVLWNIEIIFGSQCTLIKVQLYSFLVKFNVWCLTPNVKFNLKL
jgi:hypothetical protein